MVGTHDPFWLFAKRAYSAYLFLNLIMNLTDKETHFTLAWHLEIDLEAKESKLTVDGGLNPDCVLVLTLIGLSKLTPIDWLKDKIDIFKACFNHVYIDDTMLHDFDVSQKHGLKLVYLKL